MNFPPPLPQSRSSKRWRLQRPGSSAFWHMANNRCTRRAVRLRGLPAIKRRRWSPHGIGTIGVIGMRLNQVDPMPPFPYADALGEISMARLIGRKASVGGRETWRSSIWQSTASYGVVISSHFGSTTSHRPGYAVDRATVRQKNTGRPVRFELTEQTRRAVDGYIKAAGKNPGEFLLNGRGDNNRCMTTRQNARLVAG